MIRKLLVLLSLFITTQSFAIVVNDWNGVCGAYKYDEIYAVFEPNAYTCVPGYFLPAHTITCAACPEGFSCPGGTYYYNEKKSQGLTQVAQYITVDIANACAKNFRHNLNAVFIQSSVDCSAGQYLPAATKTCAECLANSICSGGSYTYNETTDQGIQSCASGTFAPSGSAVCYQHILHVGNDNIYLRSTKQTTPSLNIQIGNDIFYANMTTSPTYMNKDLSHYLHILYEGDDYYVCDDTTHVAPSE